MNLTTFTTREPTYWPTDVNKLPDLLDFFISKNIAKNNIEIKSNLDLSSDHTPVILFINTKPYTFSQDNHYLYNSKTNWRLFRECLDKSIDINIALKDSKDIDNSTTNLINLIQNAIKLATPKITLSEKHFILSTNIKKIIAMKRRQRRIWQNTHFPEDKKKLNKISKDLKNLLEQHKNNSINNFVTNLTANKDTNYSIWKVIKKNKTPFQYIPPILNENNLWAKSNIEKVEAFANHFETVFKPFEIISNNNTDQEILKNLDAPFQLSKPIKPFKTKEILEIIKLNTHGKKAPGMDLVNGTIIKNLSEKSLVLIKIIFNAILRIFHFPKCWKTAQIILIPKPGKKPELTSSYRPISLLPILSKIFEKLLLKRLKPILADQNLIPNHQFGFRNNHSTIEQVHRIVKTINQSFEEKKYCSAIFLDIMQAFDKVWHTGLLYKLKSILPYTYYQIFKSYILNRSFVIKFKDAISNIKPIYSGVPQGSVLGPILYMLYTY